MEKTLLTKREYLGEGFFHQFRNTKTGEVNQIEITEAEYLKLSGVEGEKFNPIPDKGWVYDYSFGGALKVTGDPPFLGEKEFCIKDGFYYVADVNHFGNLSLQKHIEEEFNNKFIWQ